MLNLEYFYYKIYRFLADFSGLYFDIDEIFSSSFVVWLKVISIILSSVFIAGIVYTVFAVAKYRKKQLKDFVKFLTMPSPEERTNRWVSIKKRVESDSSSDWRLAIIEADEILDDIIERMGYSGNNLGERLAKVKPFQFINLKKAQEAHSVKRRVEHEGGVHYLTKEIAENTIDMYKSAFKELEYI